MRIGTVIGGLFTASLGSMVLAQVMFPHRHPLGPIPPLSPPQINGSLRYWWVASDLGLGLPVTNWLDRINGQPLEEPTLTSTNTVNGVEFVGAQQLSASPNFGWGNPTTTAANYTTVFVFQPSTSASTMAFMTAANCCPNGGLQLNSGGTYSFRGDLASFNTFSSWSTAAINELDISCLYKSDGTAATNWWYSSGSLFATHNSGEGQGSGLVEFLGVKSGAATPVPYRGHVREIIWYSNSLDQASITLVHRYLTNKYGYSP